MKKRWSSLSQPDCHHIDMTDGQLTPFEIKDEKGNEIGCDKWENNYHTRSKVNDETLKKKHILFLGDSFVYGHGVKRGNTISDYFNEMVSEDYSCFNLGEPGTGFDTALLRLQQWCNGYGDQVHAIYFGISEITRHRHWETLDVDWKWEDDIMGEDKNFYDHFSIDYSPSFHNATGKTGKRVNTIRGKYNQVLSKANSTAKLHATISAVINLSKVHNFKVYFFSSGAAIPTSQTIKEQTVSHQVKWCNAIGSDPIMIAWEQHAQTKVGLIDIDKKRKDEIWNSYYIPGDGHWNSKGCNLMSRLLYEETNDWY